MSAGLGWLPLPGASNLTSPNTWLLFRFQPVYYCSRSQYLIKSDRFRCRCVTNTKASMDIIFQNALQQRVHFAS